MAARLGIVGQPILIPPGKADREHLLNALRDMQVSIVDQAGTTLGGGKGSDVLEHPLNAVIWLAQAIAKEGLRIEITYAGLPGAQPVNVSFN